VMCLSTSLSFTNRKKKPWLRPQGRLDGMAVAYGTERYLHTTQSIDISVFDVHR
jgi:hypothetical protein